MPLTLYVQWVYCIVELLAQMSLYIRVAVDLLKNATTY